MELTRRRLPELMDDPALDAQIHRRALHGLARLNRAAGVDRAVWRVIGPLARNSARPLRVLDVATGAGDLLARMARRARRDGCVLDLHASDSSNVALEVAQVFARNAGAEISVERIDVLNEPLPEGFDVAHCGLFLHHFDPPEVVRVLRRMARAAETVVVQDLRRTRRGIALAAAASRLLTRSHIVHVDAVRSAHAAFTLKELREMADAAGLLNAEVRAVWPQRQLLVWRRSQ